jgi:hypothetical protein
VFEGQGETATGLLQGFCVEIGPDCGNQGIRGIRGMEGSSTFAFRDRRHLRLGDRRWARWRPTG